MLAVLCCQVFWSCRQLKEGAPVVDAPETGVTLFEGQEMDTVRELTTIALGSCNRQDLEQPMWPFILENNPQLWIWLGDNIYGDTEDMNVMKEKYLRQKSHPGYRQLREKAMIVGTWDDHDYGTNDGGKEYPRKEESKMLMLDFLDVPVEATVRSREGAYQSYMYGPPGRRVKVILLDARSFRDDIERTSPPNRRYLPNPDGDILGEQQWKWLEEELTGSPAQVHLIGSGIQFIPEEHAFEKWANFPKARQRLFDLLAQTRPGLPVLLSGDRHIAEVSKFTIDGWDQPLYEITSSGLTHSYEAVGEEANRFRQGNIFGVKNFGIITIDWKEPAPEVRLFIKGLDNRVLQETLVD